jgi:hypothetical protein
VCEAPGFGFAIRHYSEPQIVGNWFPPIYFGARWSNDNSYACPRSGVICLAEALGLSPDVGAGPSSPGGVPDMEIGPPLSGEAPDTSAGVSSPSWIEGMNRSCANTPRGGDSQLDPSWARASAASLPHQRM